MVRDKRSKHFQGGQISYLKAEVSNYSECHMVHEKISEKQQQCNLHMQNKQKKRAGICKYSTDDYYNVKFSLQLQI